MKNDGIPFFSFLGIGVGSKWANISYFYSLLKSDLNITTDPYMAYRHILLVASVRVRFAPIVKVRPFKYLKISIY